MGWNVPPTLRREADDSIRFLGSVVTPKAAGRVLTSKEAAEHRMGGDEDEGS
jgi:hypothetical protein